MGDSQDLPRKARGDDLSVKVGGNPCMGIGFTLALMMISFVRELVGNGTLFGYQVFGDGYEPALMFILAPGGFLVFGFLMALVNKVLSKNSAKKSDGEEAK